MTTPLSREDLERLWVFVNTKAPFPRLFATIAERDAQIAVLVDACTKLYVDMSSPHAQVTFHYCAICGSNRDDVLATEPIEHAGDCPLHTLPASASALLDRVKELEANQRTPGTVEVCPTCSKNQGDEDLLDWRDCPQQNCPLRSREGEK